VKKIVGLVIALVFSFSFSFAQKAKITGKVINSKTGEPVIGATVSIASIKRSIATDLNGIYTLGGLASGTYTVIASSISFSKKSVEDVLVKDGDVVTVNISLDEAANKIEEVVVKSTKVNRENASAVLTAQKNSPSVSDGISAEAIRKTPDRNTSDVLKRVSGASIQDDRFVIIRGLNDRYNAAFINGAALPSSESDRKAFAFDIFPSNILDNLVIYKTATPDLSGEFAGGLINITTKSIPSKKATTVAFGFGYNTLITGKESITYKGGKTDFLGIDDGTRKLPDGIPSTQPLFTASSAAQRAAAGKKFENNWGTYGTSTAPNVNFQVTQSLVAERKGKEFFGALLSVTYNNNNSYNDGERYGISDYDRRDQSIKPTARGDFREKYYNNQTLLGFVGNFSLKLSNNAKISWKNIYSINSTDRTITREGNPDVTSDADQWTKSYALWFTSNKILSSQLNGEHYFTKSKFKLNWLISLGNINREIPQLRQLSYYATTITSPYEATIPKTTVSNDNAGSMLYVNNKETITNYKLDISRQWDWSRTVTGTVKFGGFYQSRNRDFSSRLLGITKATDNFDNTIVFQPESTIFQQSNFGIQANGKQGLTMLDGTKSSDKYDASSTILAGYAMMDQKLHKKLRVIYGTRIESFNQKLNSFKTIIDPININTTKTDVLPSINTVYSLDSKQNIRVSYAKTLNRPEFRELAPFAFFDFATRYNNSGIDTLKRATIDNYDLRYEIYPGKAQLFSVSLFYKAFVNPIELVSSPDNANEAIYQNALTAKVYGAELEFRYLLSSLFGGSDNSVLQKLTWTGNASVIKSRILLGNLGGFLAKDLNSNRPLQGQSPYVLNSAFTYSDDKRNVSFTASVNRVGERIFIVGTVNDADIWEKARTVVDLQLAKSYLNNKLEIKLNVRDLLAQKQIFYWELNQDTKYTAGVDQIFSSATFGRVISLGFNYKF
jgi:TonB-dependent receptor